MYKHIYIIYATPSGYRRNLLQLPLSLAKQTKASQRVRWLIVVLFLIPTKCLPLPLPQSVFALSFYCIFFLSLSALFGLSFALSFPLSLHFIVCKWSPNQSGHLKSFIMWEEVERVEARRGRKAERVEKERERQCVSGRDRAQASAHCSSIDWLTDWLDALSGGTNANIRLRDCGICHVAAAATRSADRRAKNMQWGGNNGTHISHAICIIYTHIYRLYILVAKWQSSAVFCCLDTVCLSHGNNNNNVCNNNK